MVEEREVAKVEEKIEGRFQVCLSRYLRSGTYRDCL